MPFHQGERAALAASWEPNRLQDVGNDFKCISGLAPSYLAELVQQRKRDGRLRQNYAPTLHQGITIGVLVIGHLDCGMNYLWTFVHPRDYLCLESV